MPLKRVLWISIGYLRFAPRLIKLFLKEKRQNLLNGEFITGEDGKFPLHQGGRIWIYSMLYRLLKEKEPDLLTYLCMERPDVWRQATGADISGSKDLIALFDERIGEFYGGLQWDSRTGSFL